MQTHPSLILNIFTSCNYNSYLELGVCEGSTLSVIAPFCHNHLGIDIEDRRSNTATNFKLMSTDEFFASNSDTFDMIFIDADHSYSGAKRDFENSLKILNLGGTIIMHDTDPQTSFLTVNTQCGDCYRIVKELDSYNVQHVTLPFNNCGLTIIREKTNRSDYHGKL